MKILLLLLISLIGNNTWASPPEKFPSVEEELKAYFFAAARSNDVVVLKKFIETGFPVDAVNSKGYTALMIATYHGHTTAFDYLVSQKANTCAVDIRGNTVLMAAIFRGEFSLAKKLLSYDCNPDHKNNAGMTAAGFAKMFGRNDVLNHLRK
ncbi:MAG TPA: ankyrin repeat domain-containing protein [Gammaproteobacteria bacterium]|nr:ankyrin repeat domain-containing protein [Gammaproteobacteria bacterium]